MTSKHSRRSDPKSGSASPRLDRDVQAKIGEGLRAIYDDVVKQGVPDRFAKILAQLESEDDAGDPGASSVEGGASTTSKATDSA